MRKKSPASVQKWVDSIQIPPSPGTAGPTVVIDSDEPGPSGLNNAELQLAHPDHQMTASTPDCLMEEHPAGISEDEDHVLTMATTPQTPAPPPPMVSSSDEEFNPAEEMASTAPAAIEHKPEVGSAGGTSSSSISIKNLLSKKTLLEKFSRSATNLEQQEPAATLEPSPDQHEEPTESRKSTSLASIGKIKINEFYDKLSMNKAKYSLIKAKKLDLRNILAGGGSGSASQRQTPVEEALPEMVVAPEVGRGVEQMVEVHQQQQQQQGGGDVTLMESDAESRMMHSEASGKLSTGDIYEFSFDESFPKDEDIIPDIVSETDEEKENLDLPLHHHHHHQQQLHQHYLNPPAMVAAAAVSGTTRMGIGKIGRSSSENPRANKRFNLMEIGRSFSEMNDDDNFVISECNNSCPNPSSLNTSSSINNSSSNILARSVPVSPIPRTSSKLSIQQENNSLSESPRRRSAMLMKDNSLQSDSSRCSSVESLLNARKPDPERILLNLGFGPAPHSTDVLSKIPKRFLKPSQVRGVDTEAFLRQQQLSMHIHENSVLGYRGLVGNPHIPPSMIVAKIMERFQENERGRMARGGSIPGGTIDLQQAAGHLHHHHHNPASSSRESSGPPSPIPIPRHSSLASEGRIKF